RFHATPAKCRRCYIRDVDSPVPPDIAAVRDALPPLSQVPSASAWNLGEAEDLLPAGASVPAAVRVGLVARAGGPRARVPRRPAAVGRRAGQVSCPGGRVEAPDRDGRAAAIRAADEEVGLLPARIMPMGWLDPLATVSGFTVLPLVATLAA